MIALEAAVNRRRVIDDGAETAFQVQAIVLRSRGALT